MSPVERTLLGLVGALLLVSAAQAEDIAHVSQKQRAFSVQEIRIHPGDTVRFDNDDDFSHQIFVQSSSFSYESDEQDPGHTVDVTFPKTGTYDVQCHIHPKMHLRVDVR